MCGRMALYTPAEIPQRFNAVVDKYFNTQQEFHPRYNSAPNSILPIVIYKNEINQIKLMRWGFMPPWSKSPTDIFKYNTFNAKAEHIFDKPMWRKSIRNKRCLIPANGFFEWRNTPSGKQPYFIRPKQDKLFAFAGIYNSWNDVEGLEWLTYSIITTKPNNQMELIHNRMPVILKAKDEERWLNPVLNESEEIVDLLRPYDNNGLEIVEVSREVNNARNDNEDLIRPLNSK